MRHIIVLRIEADDPDDRYSVSDLYEAMMESLKEVHVHNDSGHTKVELEITATSAII
jgi:hypothetical protein